MLITRSARTDRPRLEPRVRMRVKVKVLQTTLPLAHDEVFTEHGKQGVKQGTHEIIVYRSDVPKVLAKVETETEQVRRAHEIFWRGAVDACLATNKNRGEGALDPAEFKVPPTPCDSVNAWVRREWSEMAKKIYFSWLDGVHDEKRSPQSIFRVTVGRTMHPLESAEMLPSDPNDPTLEAPIPEEHQQTVAMVDLLRRVNAPATTVNNGGADVSAVLARLERLEAENAQMRNELGMNKPAAPAKGAKSG